jgi:NAD(P)-dependent dehydrogenase (short-subunit alcohol dehydrogenase family)
MPASRAAIVTGASSGIGLAIAQVLAAEGHALTINARRPEKLENAAQALQRLGADVHAIAGNMADEQDVKRLVDEHRSRRDRLDVLVNCAGVGAGAALADIDTRRADLQLDVNLRAPILLYRETVDLLRAAGAEHRGALVVNVASISAKRGRAWLSVYSATKAGLVAFTEAMNEELNADGIKSVALAPAWVDTPMSDFVKDQIAPEDMISAQDVAEAVRFLLRLSPTCVVPEIIFQRPGETL